MNRLAWQRTIATVAAIAVCAGPSRAQTPSPMPIAPKPIGHIVSPSDISGIPGKEGIILSVEWPPGGRNGRHYHHGDEYAYVTDGTLELDIDNQKPLFVHAGESYHNIEGAIHETRNTSAVVAHSVTFFVVDKSKLMMEPAP